MRVSTFALWSTALAVSASIPMATGQEQTLPEFFEAHEIGYIDLNSPQEMGGWLSTIPASSPMWSVVARNDGRNQTATAPVAQNPLAGRATASAPTVGTFTSTPATPAPPTVSTRPPTQVNPPQTGGDNSAAPTTRRRPPTERVPTPTVDTTTTVQTPVQPRVVGDRFPARFFPGWGGFDPLIHFYADSAVTVNVKAGIHKGIPVAWWPRGLASGETVEFRDLRVDPRLNPVTSSAIDTQKWPGLKPLTYLRDAMATPVKLGNKIEGGISYEGIMPIAPDLTVRMSRKGLYEIRNDSEMELVNAVLIPFGETHNGVALGTIKPGAVVHVDLAEAAQQPLAALMAKHLGKTGLFPAEIAGLQKLILTPEFRLNPGARLLAQFSDAEWAKRFPLEIAPAPKRLVRVGMLRIFDAQAYNATGDRVGNGRPAPGTQLTGQGQR